MGSSGKQWAALSSLIAAIGLTAFKIIVGSLTGSLGILAEAAHSGLDLVAALLTVFAVRVSGRPPDASHTYGHGKVENLSAAAETLLLFATCAWIIYQAVVRLIAGSAPVEVTFWSFFVMATSIVVDVSRSRVLAKAAKRYKSEALEADALHFQTDVWSSAVVIFGLICVKTGQLFPEFRWLSEADAAAALGVAVIVIVLSSRLGLRSIQALMDATPAGYVRVIKATVEGVPGVVDCHDIRVRPSGGRLFADIHVTLNGDLPLKDAHALTEQIEAAVQTAIPDLDLVVHAEPR